LPTISFRISDEEKGVTRIRTLLDAVRKRVRLYLQSKKTRKALDRLRTLQAKDRAKTTTLEELELIREDRNR